MELNFNMMHGDCLQMMDNIDDQSVDLILTDLPYFVTKERWDLIIPFEPLWKQYWRICKGSIVLTSSQPFTTKLISSQIEYFRYCWVWDKTRATNFMSAKLMPLIKTEDVCVFSKSSCNSMSKNKMVYNPQGVININKTVKNGKNVGGKVAQSRNAIFKGEYLQETTNYPKNILDFPLDSPRIHPTQKPVALMEYLIKTYTHENDVVLDSTCGSGTTGVAAAQCGRNFIGIEKDKDYFEYASKRVADAYNKKELFGF